MAIVTSYNFRRAALVQLVPLMRSFYLRLFVNDVVPVEAFTEANYVEPGGSWYRPVPLTEWGNPFKNAANQGEVDEIIRTFIAGGTVLAESVYGYWVTDGGGLLCWAERGPGAPYPMDVAGKTLRVMPRLMDGLLC